MNADDAVNALGALAQATRLAIFRDLVKAGAAGRTAGELVSALDVPASSASFHFKALVDAGLIEGRSQGRHVVYTARFDRMDALLAFLTENCCRDSDTADCRWNGSQPGDRPSC